MKVLSVNDVISSLIETESESKVKVKVSQQIFFLWDNTKLIKIFLENKLKILNKLREHS